MEISDWLPAITSSTILGIIGFASGAVYKAAIESGFRNRVETELEKLKAVLRQDEEALKTDYRRQEEQIAALRQGALAGLASRHQYVEKRRLDAIERLWEATVEAPDFTQC